MVTLLVLRGKWGGPGKWGVSGAPSLPPSLPPSPPPHPHTLFFRSSIVILILILFNSLAILSSPSPQTHIHLLGSGGWQYPKMAGMAWHGMVWYGMAFSSLPWGFSVADYIKYYAYFYPKLAIFTTIEILLPYLCLS